MNYTLEQASMMVKLYKDEPNRSTVEFLAANLNKSIKSIIGKLSREGVYRREVYRTKQGERPITKLEIVENIAETLQLESESLIGLDKAPKAVLKLLEASIS